MEGSGCPYAIGPWTGKITALGVYDGPRAGHVTVPITAVAGEAVIIAVAAQQSFGIRTTGRYAVSAETDVVQPAGQVPTRSRSGSRPRC
jgi:hypothetical protein